MKQSSIILLVFISCIILSSLGSTAFYIITRVPETIGPVEKPDDRRRNKPPEPYEGRRQDPYYDPETPVASPQDLSAEQQAAAEEQGRALTQALFGTQKSSSGCSIM